MPRDLRELLSDASRGDSATLDELVARYLPRLHAYVRIHMSPQLRAREASADVVQSVCREVLEERGVFEFRGEASFLRWLLTAAVNKLRERARFRARRSSSLRMNWASGLGRRDCGARPVPLFSVTRRPG